MLNAAPILDANQVDLWLLDEEDASKNLYLNSLIDCLSEDEQARASKIKSPSRKTQFQHTRIALRHILSLYLPHVAPAEHQFVCSANGKPALKDNACRFNLSHTKGKILIGVSLLRELGVDIELMDAGRNIDGIAKDYFHTNEWKASLTPKQDKVEHFYKIWTLKEAFIKAEGKGLFLPANAFYFNTPESGAITIFNTDNEQYSIKDWALKQCLVDDKYSMAVAFAHLRTHEPANVSLRQFHDVDNFPQIVTKL